MAEYLDPKLAELDRIIKEATPLVDRVHKEYQKYLSGAEKKPPRELKEKLEKLIDRATFLLRHSKMLVLNFQAQTLLAKYHTVRANWEKKLRDREVK